MSARQDLTTICHDLMTACEPDLPLTHNLIDAKILNRAPVPLLKGSAPYAVGPE